MIENRKTYRLPFRTKFVFGSAHRVSTGNAVNISAGGIFVATLEPFPRETVCKVLFTLRPDEEPVLTEAIVKRVVAPADNPEVFPGMGFNFLETLSDPQVMRVQDFMEEMRKNYESAATILSSGEPDLATLEPLLRGLHLPPLADLGELRFYVERVLRSIELVESTGPTTPAIV